MSGLPQPQRDPVTGGSIARTRVLVLCSDGPDPRRLEVRESFAHANALHQSLRMNRKVAVVTAKSTPDSHLSMHFGSAKWVAIFAPDAAEPEIVRNEGLNGRSVVEIMSDRGCTDAIFSAIGPGAHRHLCAAGIRGWLAPVERSAPDALRDLELGALSPAGGPTHERRA